MGDPALIGSWRLDWWEQSLNPTQFTHSIVAEGAPGSTNIVPEPKSVLLLLLGLAALGMVVRRR